jgi:predicted nucleic acid-binding protein
MEVLVGSKNESEKELLKKFLKQFIIIEITPSICEIAVNIRAQRRMALPDAIIWATAKNCNGCLITRNHKDFPEKLDGIRIPYRLNA